MGSSKKHKDRSEKSKKKKHGSRSHEKHEKHSKKHKEKKERREREKEKEELDIKEYEYSLIEKGVDIQIEQDLEDGEIEAPPPPKILKTAVPTLPPPPRISSSGELTLSIEETNRLRAKLGLKPLQEIAIKKEKDEDKEEKPKPEELQGIPFLEDSLGKFYHKPAEDLAVKKKAEKLKEKLKERKEKRKHEAKLSKVKGLGELDGEEESTIEWIKQSRLKQEQREQAERRAKMLEELDEEFGIGSLVDSEFQKEKKDVNISRNYTYRDLKGLRVEHSHDSFMEGRSIILTLKDKDILDENPDDVLVNVNIMDEERAKKNVLNRKKKPGYDAYEEPDLDEYGNVKPKNVLAKYDEEIRGEKKSNFILGRSSVEDEREKELLVKWKLKQKSVETLGLPQLQLASDYYTQAEVVKFKKPKKKIRKVHRKILRADDLLAMSEEDASQHLGSRSGQPRQARQRVVDEEEEEEQEQELEEKVVSETEGLPSDAPVSDTPIDVPLDLDEGEMELQRVLNKARKIKLQEQTVIRQNLQKLVDVENVKAVEEEDDKARMVKGHIVLNSTAEFCRSLGDIPTYGLAGNRDEDADELMDFERELLEERRRLEEEGGNKGAWNEVEIDEAPVEIKNEETQILDEEPDVGNGIGGALRVAVSKGYLEKEVKKNASNNRMQHLQAQVYSIEDKQYYDDDKFGRGRDRYSGPVVDFKERDNYKPDVKLEYIDDGGRVLNAKEAFRYLSHKFHGKGPGKNKTEKRMKKVQEETLMKQMSSTDTPLGTLTLLQQKQKETQSPYVVLSGNKALQSTSLVKSKPGH